MRRWGRGDVQKALSSLSAAGLLRVTGSGSVAADLYAAQRLLGRLVHATPLGGQLEQHPDLVPLTRFGRLVEIPATPRARHIVGRGVADALPDHLGSISEHELGDVLSAIADDTAGLRRLLVDEGVLRRDADGAHYYRTD